MKKEMQRFKRKLLAEGLLKSFIGGVICGAGVLFLFLIVMHLLSNEPRVWMMLAAFGAPFVFAGMLLFVIRYYPTRKRVAGRIDASGLEERVGTMLELKNEATLIARLQREDAMEHLRIATTKQMKMQFRKAPIIACAILLSLCIGMMFVPYTIMGVIAAEATERAEEEKMIKEMIEALRQTVDEAKVSDTLKNEMYDIIDELEKSISKDDTTLEKVAKISQAEKKIQELLAKAVTKYAIGSALQQFESTKELGKAISAGDTDAVSAALLTMKESFEALSGQEQADLLATVSDDISQALALSQVESGDALYDALATFSEQLADLGKKATGTDVTDGIETAVSEAEAAIIAALGEQADIEATAESFSELMEETKDELLGNESESEETEEGEQTEGEQSEGEEGEKPEGEEGQQDGEKPEGEENGEQPEGEGGEFSGEGEGSGLGNMTEEIYDSTTGNVEYGEVFAAYYAEYLKSLEEGEIPEDMQTIIEEYYNSLNQ